MKANELRTMGGSAGALLGAMGIISVLTCASAATRTWDGGGANDFWNTALNWSGNVAPVAGDDLVFAGTAPLVSTNNFPAGTSFNTIRLTGGGHVLRGNEVTLQAGLHASNPTGANTVALPLRLGADQSFTNSAAGGLTLTGGINMNAKDLTFQNDGGNTTVVGAISGGGLGGLAKFGAGTLTLNGPSTHFQSAVLGGTLVLNSKHSGLVAVWSGGTLRGTGAIGAELFMNGGTVDAGNSPGQLSVSGPILEITNSGFRFELNGLTPGAGYDQLVIGSGVRLGNSVLQVVPGMNFAIGTTFTIMNLTSSGKVTNTFASLPEGAFFGAGGQIFQITYQGGTGNDVVLTRKPTVFFGLNHLVLGQAILSENALGELTIGNLGASGNDGASIPLGDAAGWWGKLSPPPDDTVIAWKIRGILDGVADQILTMGRMQLIGSDLRFFADAGAVGATAHLVEGFRDGVLVESAVVPTDQNIFSIQFWTNNTVISMEHQAPAPGRRWWQSKFSWSNPQRIVLGSGSGLPIIDADAVRIRPMPVEQSVEVEPPATLELTGVGLPQITILDEALLYLPKPSHKPYPHHAIGQAQLEAQGGKLHVSNIGDTGRDGVSIEAGNCTDGLLVLTDPIGLQSDGAMLILAARGIFDNEPERPLGIASLKNERDQVQVIADFASVGSSRLLVEVFNGNTLVGSAVLSGGQSVATLTPGRTGRLPDINAVGVVPPDLLPRFNGIDQGTLDPVPCYLFAFNGTGTFTLNDGRAFEGDIVRLISVDPDGFVDALSFFDITAQRPLESFTINYEKPRYATPQVHSVSPLSSGLPYDVTEIRGRGFGDNPHDLAVVAVAGNSNGPITALFRVLSATDTRLTARITGVHPNAEPGPLLVARGAGMVSGLMAQVPGSRGVWTWQRGGPSSAATTTFNPMVFMPGVTCFYSDPPVDGTLQLTLNGGWPSGATVSVGVNAHDTQTGIGSFALHAPLMPLPGGASLLQCAQAIAHTLEAALQAQQGIIVVVTIQQISANSVRLVLEVTGGYIDQGFFYVCVKPPPSIDNTVIDIRPGGGIGPDPDPFEIFGTGFGIEPDDLSISVMNGGSARLIPFRALTASDSRITARLGPVPPDAMPGPIVVSRGEGSRGGFQPAFANVVPRAAVWIWQGREPAALGPEFDANSATPPPGTTWFHSDVPRNGVMGVTLTGNWPSNALVSVAARAHDLITGAGSFDLDAPATQILGAGGVLECAERIADIIRCAFQQQAGLTVGVRVDPTLVRGTARLTVFLPEGGYIDRGGVTICVSPPPSPPVITDVQPREGETGHRIVITGQGFGSNPDNLLVYVHGSNGVPTVLRVISATDTRLVADITTVHPDAAAGPIVVRHGIGTLLQPNAGGIVSDEAALAWRSLDDLWTSGPTFKPKPGLTSGSCFSSFTDQRPFCNPGEVCIWLVGDWPLNGRVTIQSFLSPNPVPPSPSQIPSSSWFAHDFQISGGNGSWWQCAQDIAQLMCLLYDDPLTEVAEVNCEASVVGTNTAQLTLRGPLTFQGFAPLYGYLTICHRPPIFISDIWPLIARLNDRVTINGSGFGTDPSDLLVYVEGDNGVRTLLPVISVTETQIVAQVNILRPDAQPGPIMVARGVGQPLQVNDPEVQADLQQWRPSNDKVSRGPVLSLDAVDLFTDVCYYSQESNGVVCLVIGPDYFPACPHIPGCGIAVEIDFQDCPSQEEGGVFSVEAVVGVIYLSHPLSPVGFADYLCSLLGMFHDPPAQCNFTTLPDGRVKIIFFSDVPLCGEVNICYRKFLFEGLPHIATGQAKMEVDAADRLLVSNLGPSGEDGVQIELGAAQGWAADFMPFKLGHGQRLTVSHFGSPGGFSTQRMARTWMEVDDGQTFLSSDWSYVGSDRYVLVIQNELGRALEWAVFDNNQRVAVDSYFPQICNEQAITYSASVFVDQHWMRFCKAGCDCFGTNCWHEILVCTFPFNLGLLTNVFATAVELNLGSFAMTSPVAEAIAAEPFLTWLTFNSEHLKSLGRFHRALGQATLEAEPDRLRVRNFGSAGTDGVAIEFDRFANFLGLPPTRGHQIAWEPLTIPVNGAVHLAAKGSTGTLATAVFRNTGSSLQIAADFSSIGATQALVEIYRNRTRVGSAFAGLGAHVTLTPGDIRNDKLEIYDWPGEYASRFGGVFEGTGNFLLPSGISVMGDEIRLLAVGASNLTETLSTLEITGTGLDTLTILSETSLDVSLGIERVDGNVRVFWPKPAPGFLLQETHTLGGSPTPWTQVPVSTYQTNQTDISISVPAPSANKFYRLRRQ